jgi:hypothetical protein
VSTSASPPPRTPSAAELATMLSDDVAPPPPRDVVSLPRPRWWLRTALVMTVAVLAMFAAGTVIAAAAVERLSNDLVASQHLRQVAARPAAPPVELLLDDAAYREALQRHPDEVAHLALLRASAQSDRGNFRDAERTCAEVTASRCTGALRLVWAEALLAQGKPDAAQQCLDLISGQRLSEPLTVRLAELATRIHFQTRASAIPGPE